MFPTYQVYYSNFLEKIGYLPESVQTALVSILKARCESGYSPSKNYKDSGDYYDFTRNLTEEQISFLDRFDEEFYPSELVPNENIIEFAQIISQMTIQFQHIKSKGFELYKTNPTAFLFDTKNIFDQSFESSASVINKLLVAKRAQYDGLLIKYYDDMITQDELDKLVNTKNLDSISSLGSAYHNFLSTRFMQFGIMMCKEVSETRKKLDESGLDFNSQIYLELKSKLDISEAKGLKFSNTHKALEIINWLVYANEYKFLNKFFKVKKQIEKEIETYAMDNLSVFDEETGISTENGVSVEKTNKLEVISESLNTMATIISNIIIKKIEQDLINQSQTLVNKKEFIKSKTEEYLQDYVQNYSGSIDNQVLKAIRDLVALELSMYGLGESLDDAFITLNNCIQQLNSKN
jgi:hypothetical protein